MKTPETSYSPGPLMTNEALSPREVTSTPLCSGLLLTETKVISLSGCHFRSENPRNFVFSRTLNDKRGFVPARSDIHSVMFRTAFNRNQGNITEWMSLPIGKPPKLRILPDP